MIHLLFGNVLYPQIDRADKIYINKEYIVIESKSFEKPLALDILSHPHVKELLAEDDSLKDVVLYQTFSLICQRFSGKTLLENKLVRIENEVFNLDGALFKLQRATSDTAKAKGEIEQ